MENNQKSFGLARRNKLLIFLFVSVFIIVGFIFIGKFAYPVYALIYYGETINFKSDAEIIAQFQAHKEEFNQIPDKEAQIQKDLQTLKIELRKKIDVLINQLNTNKELSADERTRLQKELDESVRLNNFPPETEKRKEIIKFFAEQGFPNSFDKGTYCNKGYDFRETISDRYDIVYKTSKGLIYFDENKQPDKRYVVDNLDNFHASNNIK